MAMSDNTTPDTSNVPAQPEQPIRPLQLGQRHILQHMLPKAVPDEGLAKLDVAAFCSSI